MFEIVYDDGRTTDGRRLDGYPISSPCEPNGSGELINIYTVDKYEWRYERCISKLGHEIYVDGLQTVSVNVNDAHRYKMNGCTGETAGIAWIPDKPFITGNVHIIKIQQIQQKKNI